MFVWQTFHMDFQLRFSTDAEIGFSTNFNRHPIVNVYLSHKIWKLNSIQTIFSKENIYNNFTGENMATNWMKWNELNGGASANDECWMGARKRENKNRMKSAEEIPNPKNENFSLRLVVYTTMHLGECLSSSSAEEQQLWQGQRNWTEDSSESLLNDKQITRNLQCEQKKKLCFLSSVR